MKEPSSQTEEKFSWLDVPKSIWYFLGENKAKYVSLNVLLFTVHFYELVPPYILGKVVDFFSNYKSGDSLKTFYIYAFSLGGSSILIALIRLTSKKNLTKIALATKTKARVEGFQRLMDFSLLWHSEENSGNRVQRIFTGSASLPEWSHLTNNGIFPVAASFIGVLGVFLFLSPPFLIFLLIYTIAFFSTEYIFNKKLSKLSDQVNQLREKSSGAYIEGAGNILAIKALGIGQNLHGHVKTIEEAVRTIELVMSSTGTKKWYTFQTINGLALTVFLLLVGHNLVAGLITVGYILVFFTYFNNLREATIKATDIAEKVVQLRSDLARMMPIFLETSPVKTGNKNFPADWKEININNGTFKYPSGQKGITNLNFTLHKNEKLGVAGLSGSGKSTLIKILLGLYELEQGKFNVGSTNFYDIAHDQVSKNIAVVLQETELFNLTLKENISVMREVKPELLKTAIDTASLGSIIEKLPKGLNTLIGERGYSLSGGERQRLGIARAICKDSPILVLDEATSSLDSQTEKQIMTNVYKNLGQKTMLIIAHRLSTLEDCDRIIVFNNGQILEEGQFEALVKNKNSKFAALYSLQAKK